MKFHNFRSKRKPHAREPASPPPEPDIRETELSLEIVRECQVCCCEQKNRFFISFCHHEACLDCWREYLSTKVETFQMANMTCIACSERLSYNDIASIFRQNESDKTDDKDNQRLSSNFARYDKFLLDQYLVQSKNTRWCPNGCGFGIIVDNPKSCPVVVCRVCQDKAFCSICSEPIVDGITHKCRSNRGDIRNFSPAQNIISNLANFFQQITGAQLPINQFRRRSSQTPRPSKSNMIEIDEMPPGLSSSKPRVSSIVSNTTSSGSINDFYQSCASSFSSMNSMVMPQPTPAHPFFRKSNPKNQNSIAIQTMENEESGKKGKKKKFKRFPAFSLLDTESQPFIGEKSDTDNSKSLTIRVIPSDASDKKQRKEKSNEEIRFSRREARPSFHSQNPFKEENSESCPGQMKQCPRCRTWVLKLKDGTCNHMYCGVCNCEFCWLCLREINSMHYLGPSGCTFWGREQWSVRKRILLVLGLAIGAPTFLAILTAIALPCIFFGFPIVIGRKVFRGFKGKPKHIRIWWTTFAVLLSIVTAPLVAILATTIGLIAAIIFIYIYMPIASFTSYVSSKKNRERQVTHTDSDSTDVPTLSSSSEDLAKKKAPLPATIEWDPNLLGSDKGREDEIEWDRLAQSSKASKYALIYAEDKYDSLEESDKIEVV